MGLEGVLEHVAIAVERDAGARPLTILPSEPTTGELLFVCGFESRSEVQAPAEAGDGGTVDTTTRSWVVVEQDGVPVTERERVRRAVAIAALCEIAAEVAFPGDLDELRRQLGTLRASEDPAEVDAALAAADALAEARDAPFVAASASRLDELGQAAQRLERALDPTTPSPFAAAMRGAEGIVSELWAEVERTYRAQLR